MSKSRHISLSLFLVFGFILPWNLIGVTPKTMAELRGEIRVVDNYRPDINVLGHNVLQYLYEYALDRNELVPCLAVSRNWVDDTTLELRLRKGVRFHNGEPFDASAVRFNFRYQRKHNSGRGVQVYLKNVQEIRIIDPHTVQMILNQPDSLILDKLIVGPISGWVIGAPDYMQKVGWEEFLKRPVGTGPFCIEGEVRDYRKASNGDVYATLAANPDYWKPDHPKIRKVQFVHYPPKQALRALIDGRVDLVTSLIPKDTLKVEESFHSKVVKGKTDVRVTCGWLNMMSPHTMPLRDLRVRKALNYALNKEEMLRYAFKGNALPMTGSVTANVGVDFSNAERYEWNIPKARELLEEAGFADGFRMKLFCQEKDRLIAQFIKRFYNLLKIEVEIAIVEWQWFPRHLVYPNTREGYSWADEDWWLAIFSQPAAVPEVVGGGFEWCWHSGAPWKPFPDWLLGPLDGMYHDLLRTTDRDERFAIYKKANEYIADQALWVFTMAALSLYGVNEEVDFLRQVSQYLYLDYSSVTDNHWSLPRQNN
jgi:peptide/nickel transport system substrate-binding protein